MFLYRLLAQFIPPKAEPLEAPVVPAPATTPGPVTDASNPQQPGPVVVRPSMAECTALYAEEELTKGAREIPSGSNGGPFIERYLRGQAYPAPDLQWCAIFASYCLMEAALECQRPTYLTLSYKERRGAKGLRRELLRRGAVAVPKPARGDLVIYHRGRAPDGSWNWTGHVRIVTSASGQTYEAIGGNERGGLVRKSTSNLRDPLLFGFVRLT